MTPPAIPGIRLREATAEDEAFLRALYRSTRDAELAPTGWSDETKQAFCDQQFTLQHRSYTSEMYAGAEYLVIEREGRAIGRLYLHATKGELNVMDIALLPDERNHGIGTKLMQQVIARADSEGRAIVLHVERKNPAQRLYSRLGFRFDSNAGVYDKLRRVPAQAKA